MTSERTVMLVAHLDGQATQLQVQLLEPDDIDGALEPHAVVVPDPPPRGTPAAVRQAGQALYRALTGHGAIAVHLQQLVEDGGERDGHRIDLQLAGADPGLVWEGMCPPDRRSGQPGIQLGLDRRFEIVRAVRPRGLQLPSVVVDRPLRWTGVLAATGPPGEPEEVARELEAALRPLDHERFGLDVTVVIASPAVRPAVEKVLGGLAHLAASRIEAVPPDTDDLVQLIVGPEGAGPNVLHLYCHGQSGAGGPALHIASRGDVAAGRDVGSIVVAAADLVGRTKGLVDLCLTVVNACQGGEAAGDPGGRSLAHSLVRDAGMPYVVAHREPVDAAEAHLTAAAVAESLASTLTHLPDPNDAHPATVFLPRLVDARRRLSTARGQAVTAAADDDPRWTVPVLFARSTPLQLTADPEQVKAAARDVALSDMLDVAGPRVPAEIAVLRAVAHASLVADAPSVTDAPTVTNAPNVTDAPTVTDAPLIIDVETIADAEPAAPVTPEAHA